MTTRNGGPIACLLAITLALSTGCAGTLPDVIYGNQVETYFPEPEEGTEGGETQHALRLEAGHCAARLNGHRSTAESVSAIQGVISAIGGLTGGVGGALAVVHFDSTDINTAMGVMGSIGAAITVVGNFILGLVANPMQELRLHAQAQESWDLAVELQFAHGDSDAVRQSLTRCTADQAPPVHLVGQGEAYTE